MVCLSQSFIEITVTPVKITEYILSNFNGVIEKSSWGETSLFYNPNRSLPNGVYFCTLKEKNGDNDKSSQLDRADVFRMSIGIGAELFEREFGARPARPAKGDVINTHHDFTVLDSLMPHPIYGWMGWVQILNPSVTSFEKLQPFIQQAYSNAVVKFDKRLVSKK